MLRKITAMYKKVDECCEQLARFQSDGVIEGFSETPLGINITNITHAYKLLVLSSIYPGLRSASMLRLEIAERCCLEAF